jgi:hypothetical protein
MIQTGYLSRNRVADSRVESRWASGTGRTHRISNLARVDFVTDNEAARGQVVEIKTPAISSAESLLLAMVEAFAADSPLSDGDEQLLSLP